MIPLLHLEHKMNEDSNVKYFYNYEKSIYIFVIPSNIFSYSLQ